MAQLSNSPHSSKELKKDTVYIDVDDEITTIIEKLQNAEQNIVALVLPKRATVMQSIVNMKLLKRTAENAKKHVVLITSEAGLLPLAGAVGLHVAGSLQSKPAIPAAPNMIDRESAINEDTGEEFDDFDPDEAADKPVGQLAGLSSAAAASEPETITMDDDDDLAAAPVALTGSAAAGAAGAAKKGRNKKLKVPNFNKFRLLLIVGGLALLLLLVGFIYANVALNKAIVTLKTNSSDIPTRKNLLFDPKASELDIESGTVPAKIASKQQTGSQQVSTSGQKNNGTKASGEVKIINCNGGEDLSIPAGTGVSSPDGLTYITQEAATMSLESSTCKDTALTADTVKVIAINPGTKFNIPATTFKVAQQPEGAVKANSSQAFSGGTDNIVKVVAQADIDSAKQKIVNQDKDNSSIKDDLAQKLLTEGYTAVTGSLQAGDPTVTPSAAVGDQADTVTVTQATNYTMYGVKQVDIKEVITANVRKQIDPTKQQILKDGADTAKYSIASPSSSGPLQVTLSASSLAGPDIKTDKLAAQLAGKKTGEVKTTVKAIPGVTDVSVKYSPFWVSSVPKKASKVHIVIEKAGASQP